MGLAGLVLLLLAAAAPAFAASDCAALRAAGTKAPRLESNEFFQVVSPTKISFRPGVQFETVRTAEGKSLVRFSFETLAVEGATDVQAIECRCQFPDVCTRNSCKVTTTGGSATCDGGCYRPDGTACVSCQFFTVQPKPQ